ncbi:1,2-phenylacetyl-CoA epoxidase subunit PaaC [Sutcliffiella rhizosphaerae]|uniref:1,2-phenylacetyl-CoA epoxidase, subunit C n=1 Tax=Sutcliffiella rhizosphaerae TaxID=2880967 RepID=A0ABM8YPM9_9BACI|nr:1,2-phenylacetyl-CoA epoxidase subunit PaaC [Sutcliffiella rhizosphaerae]CAG9621938.1 1,2-phenylacetyl-CoA epoxidase, subunit C [Sutcliffiella rhizosphaerae]
MNITSVEEAKRDSAYYEALTQLLYQLADDDFIIAYRGSEWLGLAPHIEEDVAFSSINQDTMGHAAMYYQLLEELGEGKLDYLAHGRKVEERVNAILLEKVNGTGTYLTEPKYDWAFTVVRHYFYTQYKKIKTESLKNSSYEPLKHVAYKVNMELYYHLLHWRTWFHQLCTANGDAKTRMKAAISIVLEDFGGVVHLGPAQKEMTSFQLIDSEKILRERFLLEMKQMFEKADLNFTMNMEMKRGNGRLGEHTSDLDDALKTLSEVYNSNPAAIW